MIPQAPHPRPLPARRERGFARTSILLALLLTTPAAALDAAPESGPCSLENAVPATIAAVDGDFELLLDDGRRAVLSGLEFPAPAIEGPDSRGEAAKRLSGWLAGRQVFLGGFASAPDRWGRVPARVFAASGEGAEAPLISVGAALLDEGLARFRPDAAAAACAKDYLAAEGRAREAARGLWKRPDYREIDVSGAGASEKLKLFVDRKGMILVTGVVRSIGETRGAIYLNFGERRGADFAVVISKRDLGMLERAGIFPRALAGRRARVRGLIETRFGPRMEIASPSEIELIDGAAAH